MLLPFELWGGELSKNIYKKIASYVELQVPQACQQICFFIIAIFIHMEAVVLMVSTINTVPASLVHSTIVF